MKVDGQIAFGLIFTDKQEFDEATVRRQKDHAFGDIFGFGGSHYEINAGAGDDNIHISKTGDDEYSVNINGQEFTLTREEMEDLVVKGGSGNDNIVIDDSVDVAIKVEGGSGNDKILNKSSFQSIDGGSGDDQIVSEGNFNTIRGGTGSDKIQSKGFFNDVDGGTGNSLADLIAGFLRGDHDQVNEEGGFFK
jgi:Ca2+-binding RTX toxin-like protein